MTDQKANGKDVSAQARAAAHVLAACQILREMRTPAAKTILEELEPYVYEISEIRRGSHGGSA
jgi:hypothetical protein